MATDERSLSTRDRVLLAAYSLLDTRGEISGADIVVAAWEACPRHFGLAGYETRYPDSNRVNCKVDGSTGLVARGLLEHVGPRLYRMTWAGRRAAMALRGV